MNAGHSRGGPLTTDRPTAENPEEKFTPEGTTAPRQRPAGCVHLGTLGSRRGGGLRAGLMPECAQALIGAVIGGHHHKVAVLAARVMIWVGHCPACAAVFDGRWSA